MKTWVAITIAAIFGALPAFAQDECEPPSGPPDPMSALDRTHDVISRQVEDLTERLDEFLGGKRAFEESTGTFVQAGAGIVFLKSGEIRFDHALRAKLSLPRTQERFKLLLESDPNDDLQQPLSPGARSPTESQTLAAERADVTRLSAALQLVLHERQRWLLSADTGVRLRLPPDPFARLRARRQFNFGQWRLRATETVFWFESQGLGESTRADLEIPLPDCVLFRSTSEAVWKERSRMFELSQGLALFQELTWRDVLAYKVGATGETEPNTHVRDYGLGVEYRRRIHENWLFVTVEPGLAFKKENHFVGEPSLRIGLEAVFGTQYIY